MRSSLVLVAALAIGAVASPIEKRRIVTHYEIETRVLTVYVTAGAPQPTEAPVEAPPAPAAEPTPETPEPAPAQAEPNDVQSTREPAPEPTEAPPAPTEAPVDGGYPTGEAQASLSSGPEYQAAMLYHHNAIRANHGAQPLVWDQACEDGARRTAETCTFKHPDFLGELEQGQNLFTVSGDSFNATAGIVESWYKGELGAMQPYFGSGDLPDDVFHQVGHLTQLLWKGTTKVGCVSLDCGNRMVLGDGTTTDMNKFTVCNYAPPGNYGGQYAENVSPLIDGAAMGSWAD